VAPEPKPDDAQTGFLAAEPVPHKLRIRLEAASYSGTLSVAEGCFIAERSPFIDLETKRCDLPFVCAKEPIRELFIGPRVAVWSHLTSVFEPKDFPHPRKRTVSDFRIWPPAPAVRSFCAFDEIVSASLLEGGRDLAPQPVLEPRRHGSHRRAKRDNLRAAFEDLHQGVGPLLQRVLDFSLVVMAIVHAAVDATAVADVT
jgi:hypothetical protein